MSSTVTALLTLFLVGLIPLAPTEPVLVGMGVFAASGRLSLVEVIVTAAIACSLSDHFLYAVGRIAGVRVMRRLASRPSAVAAQDWLSARVTRWGSAVLVVGRWLPAGGTIGALLTGTLRWRLRRFTPASVFGSTLWSTYVALIGYLGGAITGQPLAGLLVSLGVAVVLGLVSSFVVRRVHRGRLATEAHPTIGDEPLVAN
ncbi:MAG TPA: VTT domain-containing protein [Pseudonocardiaceae bacterium]|nr:VTT domain-containing protein [Pseudonocardiaceae bacterium]